MDLTTNTSNTTNVNLVKTASFSWRKCQPISNHPPLIRMRSLMLPNREETVRVFENKEIAPLHDLLFAH